MIQVTNGEFITAIFGVDAPWCHVTDFKYDPNNIPNDKHLLAWKGDYFCRYKFKPQSNQYFTVSTFYADENQTARRRKVLYRQTHCVVLDDVKEKLSMEEVSKLPKPSWILETSPGSEQFGYILTTPETNPSRIDNLHDGLISGGLAPDGRDPGQKGTTRYVRLPGGVNTKQSKMVDGKPFQCNLTVWEPSRTTTLEELAAPFHVDLNATRRESRIDGAEEVNDHPLLQLNDIIKVKEVRSKGRFDIICPWVSEHTGGVDNGTAVFTNGDGSLGFKCHHGACQDRTGRDLLNLIEEKSPGFKAKLVQWQTMRAFEEIQNDSSTVATNPTETSTNLPVVASTPEPDSCDDLINLLRLESPFSDKGRMLASNVLKIIESLHPMKRIDYHNQVREIMRWTKPEFKIILDDLRQGWYTESKHDISFFDEVVFIAEQNQFFDRKKRIWFTAEAYQNMYSHLNAEARTEALQGGRVTKVDKIDYAPLKPAVFEEGGVLYGNSWHSENDMKGIEGDVSRWLEHFRVLGWEGERNHVLQWMAFTILHPDKKINHMIILGSNEGCGKDWILYPLVQAMGNNQMTISGEELAAGFNDYLLSVKYLHINEAELGDHKEEKTIANRLKPLAAAPPVKLRVNQKHTKPIEVRNIINCTMTTNSRMPMRTSGVSRRFYALWSSLNVRDDNDNMMPEWSAYWEDCWEWMRNGGFQNCIWYLRNCVDLSNFNPGEAPPMTDFLREISDASKSPLQQTIEGFIAASVGLFKADIVTTEQAGLTLRTGAVDPNAVLFVEPRFCTPSRISVALKTMKRVTHVKNGVDLWVIRNHNRYSNMSKDQVLAEHSRQSKSIKSNTQFKVV